MAYCPKCGIQVERDQIPCPLCFTYIPKVSSDKQLLKENGFPHYYSMYENVRDNVLKLTFRIFSVVALLALFIPTLINFILANTLTWSLYSSSSVISFWIVIYVFSKKVKRKALILNITTICLLLALDIADKQINWSVTIAIPIFLMCVTLIWLNRMFYKKNKKRWLAFAGVITISVFVLTAWISFILGQYSNRPYTFSRSLEDMKVFLSIGAVCLILSYGFPNKWKEILKRKFHF
ncbi:MULTISPECIES: DUF6320 domain-containing protein [Bacillus]|uniref:DUF6320 domain-containing protein n=1 Tax=Bacillus TaxID=1386 RepID=UPI00099486B9|nr:DUF6320 domain-containing protein [Bacillus cereus]MBJ7983466.1 small multidrug resistance protein [Bacillus cereus]OOQ97702.1 small multidrug resistance protein [Bacillus cereus]